MVNSPMGWLNVAFAFFLILFLLLDNQLPKGATLSVAQGFGSYDDVTVEVGATVSLRSVCVVFPSSMGAYCT